MYRQFCQRPPGPRFHFRRIRLQRLCFPFYNAVQYDENPQEGVQKHENESFDPLPIDPVQVSADERPEGAFGLS